MGADEGVGLLDQSIPTTSKEVAAGHRGGFYNHIEVDEGLILQLSGGDRGLILQP